MIKFFSFGGDGPSKTYDHGITTIGKFLDSIGVDRSKFAVMPVVFYVDGEYVPSVDWDKFEIAPHDDINVYSIMPPEDGIFSGLSSIISGALNFVFGFLTPSQNVGDISTQRDGTKIEPADVRANTPQLGETVPESFGRCQIHPDYVNMPRRYYESPRVQRLEFAACVGVGSYAFEQKDIFIGDTPIIEIDGARVIKYMPGDSLAADPVHQAWHTCGEVGGTSSGTAGLTLSTELANRVNSPPTSTTVNLNSITRSDGDWPAAWGQGTLINIQWQRPYSVATVNVPGGGSGFEYDVSEITGYFAHTGAVSVGSIIGLGPIGDVKLYRVLYRTDLGSGRFTVRLADPDTSSIIPLLLPPGADVSLMFGSNINRSITSIAGPVMSVNPGNFQNSISGIYKYVFAGGAAYGEFLGPFNATPNGVKTNKMELDFVFPRGLNSLSNSGESRNRSVTIEVQWRDGDDGAWNTKTLTYTDATLDMIGFTEQIPLAYMMSPQVQVRRVGAASVDNNVFDTVNWYGLKSTIQSRASYPGWTVVTASFISGGKLAAQSENKLNVIATRMLPELQSNGTFGPMVATRDIAAACRYVWQDAGYTDSDAYVSEFLRLQNQFWRPRGETFDLSMTRGTIDETLKTILSAGMSEYTIDNGLIKPIRDGLRTIGSEERTLSYSNLNTISEINEDFKPWLHDDFDGVEAEYLDPVTFTAKTVRYVLPGHIGKKIEKIKVPGVMDRVRAWRICARRALAYLYRNHWVSFKSDMSAFNAKYWSFISVICNDPLVSQSAYVLKSWLANGEVFIESSETLETEAGETYLAAYRNLEGRLVGPFPVTRIISKKTLVLAGSVPLPEYINGAEMPHLYFGKASEITRSFNVESVTFDGLFKAQLKAVIYTDLIFKEDNNSPSE